jgi:hypothetical protein
MVQIIEDQQSAAGADLIRFHPYLGQRTGQILASWQYHVEPNDPKGPASVLSEVLSTPIDIEFCRALTVADHYGVPFIWIDDPAGLFPPSARPSCE